MAMKPLTNSLASASPLVSAATTLQQTPQPTPPNQKAGAAVRIQDSRLFDPRTFKLPPGAQLVSMKMGGKTLFQADQEQ
jgi:hypothetical protein